MRYKKCSAIRANTLEAFEMQIVVQMVNLILFILIYFYTSDALKKQGTETVSNIGTHTIQLKSLVHVI